MAARKPFIYSPLQGTDIRCVKVCPTGDPEAPIRCSLIQASLESLHYTALSYTWGDQDSQDTIYLDDTVVSVTTNLAAFLRHVAHDADFGNADTGSVNFWIDAICIDQTNTLERNSQVMRMGDIFSEAEIVMVWLGPAGEHTDEAVTELQTIARKIDELGAPMEILLNEELRQTVARMYEDPLYDDEKHILQGLTDIFSRPWWSRVWILQEVALARNVQFFCGSRGFYFGELYRSVLPVFLMTMVKTDSLYRNLVTQTAVSVILDVINLRVNYTTMVGIAENMKLQVLLATFTRKNATDPRDIVYGLLGIQSDFAADEVMPDYRISPEKVYMRVVEAHLVKYDTISILAQCNRNFSYGQKSTSLTHSWVPDWSLSDPQEREVLPWRQYERGGEKHIPYHASKDLPLSSYPWSLNEECGELKLTGSIIDRIKTLSSVAVFDVADSLSGEITSGDKALQIAREWLELATGLPQIYELTAEEMTMAIRTTMVADYCRALAKEERGFAMLIPENRPSQVPPEKLWYITKPRQRLM